MKLNNLNKQQQILFNLLLNIWKNISYKRKVQFIFLSFITICNSFAEILSISIIIPFLGILVNRKDFFENKYIQIFADKFNIYDMELMTNILLILFISIIISSTLIKLLNIYLNGKYSAMLGVDFSSQAFKKILSQRYLFHINNNTSKLISIMTTKVDLAIEVIGDILQIITSSFIALGLILALLFINPKFTLIVGTCLTIIYLLTLLFVSKRQLNINSKVISKTLNEEIKLLQEGLGSIVDTILNNNQSKIINKYKINEFKLRNYKANSLFLTRFPRYFIEGFITIFIGVYGYVLVINNNSGFYVFSLLGGLVISVQKILPNLQLVYYAYTTILGYYNSVNDLVDKISLSEPLESTINNNNFYFLKDKIEFRDVSFSYEKNNIHNIQKLNFQIKIGEKIGIIGETGEGKSTIIKMLIGLIFPDEGFIKVDGKDIFNYQYPEYFLSWRSSISYVPQQIYLNDATIAENIASIDFGEKIDLKKVKKCAKIAQIEKFINQQQDKYDQYVGERGTKLSGGQLQRIGIARALYKKNTNMIVLDEATSALDENTEKNIIDSINNNFKEKILVIVSHKFKTLKYCDRIFSVKGGSIEKIIKQNNKPDF